MEAVTGLFRKPKVQGPDPALTALQADRAQRAAEEQARSDQLVQLSLRSRSRRRALSYQAEGRSATLG